jgi:hypothetical protein
LHNNNSNLPLEGLGQRRRARDGLPIHEGGLIAQSTPSPPSQVVAAGSCMRLASPSHTTKYQASSFGLVGHIACCPGALASRLTPPAIYKTCFRTPLSHSWSAFTLGCDTTSAASMRLFTSCSCATRQPPLGYAMSCYQGPCLGMPLPARLHACRACRQPVRGVAFGSERACVGSRALLFQLNRGKHWPTHSVPGNVGQEQKSVWLSFQILLSIRLCGFCVAVVSIKFMY